MSIPSVGNHPTAAAFSQKNAQLDEDGQLLLHDLCCLWHWLLPKLHEAFPKAVVDKHEAMFFRGILVYNPEFIL